MDKPIVREHPYYAAHVRLDRERDVWVVALPGKDPYEWPRSPNRGAGLDAAHAVLKVAEHYKYRGILDAKEVVVVQLTNGEFAVFPWGWRI